jgi:hypothetical protein
MKATMAPPSFIKIACLAATITLLTSPSVVRSEDAMGSKSSLRGLQTDSVRKHYANESNNCDIGLSGMVFAFFSLLSGRNFKLIYVFIRLFIHFHNNDRSR